MKKIFFMIAAIVGIAIVSCSKPDESVSVRTPQTKTVLRNDMLGYFYSCVDFFDQLDYNIDSATLESLTLEFFSEYIWLTDTTDIYPYSEVYYEFEESLLYMLRNNNPFDDGLVLELSESDVLSNNEKVSLFYLAAAIKNLKKYQNCFALCYDGYNRYCVNYVNNIVSSNPSLKAEIDNLIGTESFRDIIVIYSDGDELHAACKPRSLFDGGYNFVSPISFTSVSECDSIKDSRIDSYYAQFNSSCSTTNNMLSLGIITPEQARKSLEQYKSYFWLMYNWAMEAYFRCLNKVPTEDIQIEVRYF